MPGFTKDEDKSNPTRLYTTIIKQTAVKVIADNAAKIAPAALNIHTACEMMKRKQAAPTSVQERTRPSCRSAIKIPSMALLME